MGHNSDPGSGFSGGIPCSQPQMWLSKEPHQHVSQWAGRRHRSDRRSTGSTKNVQRNEPWADGTYLTRSREVRPTRNLRAACKSSRQGSQHYRYTSEPKAASRKQEPSSAILGLLTAKPGCCIERNYISGNFVDQIFQDKAERGSKGTLQANAAAQA